MKFDPDPAHHWKRKNFKPNPGFNLESEDGRRALAEIETNRDLAKPIEQLVCDVHAEAMDPERTDLQNLIGVQKRLTSMMARVAQSNEDVARRMLYLTIAIALMTLAMLMIMFIEKSKETGPSVGTTSALVP